MKWPDPVTYDRDLPFILTELKSPYGIVNTRRVNENPAIVLQTIEPGL